jgi:hypothetical protein
VTWGRPKKKKMALTTSSVLNLCFLSNGNSSHNPLITVSRSTIYIEVKRRRRATIKNNT